MRFLILTTSFLLISTNLVFAQVTKVDDDTYSVTVPPESKKVKDVQSVIDEDDFQIGVQERIIESAHNKVNTLTKERDSLQDEVDQAISKGVKDPKPVDAISAEEVIR